MVSAGGSGGCWGRMPGGSGEDGRRAAEYRRAHESYLAERDAIEPLGTDVSAGGMPERVKCLHVHVAHALAKGPGVNPFGDEALRLIAERAGAAPRSDG